MAKTPANNVPISNAIKGSVFLTIKPITMMGTINNHGVIWNAFSMSANNTDESAIPVVSTVNPSIIKRIKETF